MTATQAKVETESLLVLAVDDDAVIQMNTVALLKELGHRVIEASNGAEALDIVRRTPNIDIIVSDYSMPKMTGGDLAFAVARERPGLPVILATGYAELPANERAHAQILQKPFGLEDLARVLKR